MLCKCGKLFSHNYKAYCCSELKVRIPLIETIYIISISNLDCNSIVCRLIWTSETSSFCCIFHYVGPLFRQLLINQWSATTIFLTLTFLTVYRSALVFKSFFSDGFILEKLNIVESPCCLSWSVVFPREAKILN